MKVAVLGNQAFSLVNFRSELLKDIQARGCEAIALAPDLDDDSHQALREIGVRGVTVSLSRAGLNPLRDIADMYKLWRVFRREKPDVLLSYTIKPVIYGTLAAMLAGTQARYALIAGLGYAFAAPDTLAQRIVHFVAPGLYRLALTFCKVVFMQNPDDTDDFARMGIVPRHKMNTINGTGVNLDVWQTVEPVEYPVTFTLAARLLPEKGIREFVNAARQIKRTYPQVRFLLLGGLDDNPSAIPEREISSWVEEKLLEWPGHVSIKPWLERTSVFVLPSYYREGVPRSIQEAMALGRPIITADVPGCRETVVDRENGLLVAPRDVDALSIAMQHFIDNPARIREMGRKSRQIAEQKFDVRKINRQMISAMEL